jgi:hypothetical protein
LREFAIDEMRRVATRRPDANPRNLVQSLNRHSFSP